MKKSVGAWTLFGRVQLSMPMKMMYCLRVEFMNLPGKYCKTCDSSAGFPDLVTPDVWLGPDGEIGVTWESGERSLELMFFDLTFVARLTVDSDETVLERKVVPVELKKFAA